MAAGAEDLFGFFADGGADAAGGGEVVEDGLPALAHRALEELEGGVGALFALGEDPEGARHL